MRECENTLIYHYNRYSNQKSHQVCTTFKVVGDTCLYNGFTYITIKILSLFRIFKFYSIWQRKKFFFKNWNGKNYKSPSKIRTHDLHIRTKLFNLLLLSNVLGEEKIIKSYLIIWFISIESTLKYHIPL